MLSWPVFVREVCGFKFDNVSQCRQPKCSVGLRNLYEERPVNVKKLHKEVLRIKLMFDEILST